MIDVSHDPANIREMCVRHYDTLLFLDALQDIYRFKSVYPKFLTTPWAPIPYIGRLCQHKIFEIRTTVILMHYSIKLSNLSKIKLELTHSRDKGNRVIMLLCSLSRLIFFSTGFELFMRIMEILKTGTLIW